MDLSNTLCWSDGLNMLWRTPSWDRISFLLGRSQGIPQQCRCSSETKTWLARKGPPKVTTIKHPEQCWQNYGQWGKGIVKTIWPLVSQSILAQRFSLLYQGEPGGPVGWCLWDKEIHLCCAEETPDALHLVWMKQPRLGLPEGGMSLRRPKNCCLLWLAWTIHFSQSCKRYDIFLQHQLTTPWLKLFAHRRGCLTHPLDTPCRPVISCTVL